MITAPADYLRQLWGIEGVDGEGNPINPYNNRPILSVILPTDERVFDVDLNTRTISVPTFLSVAKDHRAETIYFLVDRYYEYKDLATTSCMIEYINAEGEGGFYPAPFYDITSYPQFIDEDNNTHEAKMLIPWNIEGTVTKAAGNVLFAIRFYELDADKANFIYNLRTSVASAAVLNGMDETAFDNLVHQDEEHPDWVTNLNYKIDNLDTTIYWDDLQPTVYLDYYHKDLDSDDTPTSYINTLETLPQ